VVLDVISSGGDAVLVDDILCEDVLMPEEGLSSVGLAP
jgi:hypothetical protein